MEFLRQTPKQAESRGDLRELLSVESGGIVFSTIQNFTPGKDGDTLPILTNSRNVIVIADEAYRLQYGFSTEVDKDEAEIKYGYAKYIRDALPNASYIGFTALEYNLTRYASVVCYEELHGINFL